MAVQLIFWANLTISVAYFAITVAIVVPVTRAGQLWTNRLATATALIFLSCSVGHGLHAAQALEAVASGSDHEMVGWSQWPSAAWDMFTATVAVYYWTLRRGYGVLLGRGALFTDPAELRRTHEIELREMVAESRAAAEAERDAQAQMLAAVIANSQSLIYIKDAQGRFLLVNEAFEKAFGVSSSQVLGKTAAYLDAELAPVWQANDLRARNGPYRVEEYASGPEGRRSYESVKFPLYDAAGEFYATCGVSLDLTELRNASAAAERARDEAMAQSEIKSQFLATMSHEIRTPMNGVLGLADLLLSTALTPEQLRYAQGIHSAGNALLSVINDILDFSKIEAGKLILDEGDFAVAGVLDDVVALVTPAAQSKGLGVVVRKDPDLPSTVRGDAGRLRQILLNLASNAVKFTAAGSVTLRAYSAPGPVGPTVGFEVIDTGIGVAESAAEHLFQPFTQADSTTTRTYGGTGLGLAICRQLAEAMGGTIGVRSKPGEGSTFWCVLPFRPARSELSAPGDRPEPPARESRPPGREIGPPQVQERGRQAPGTGGHVLPATATSTEIAHLLLVEDNEINQMVAAGLLGRLGYSLDLAHDGVEALDLTGRRLYEAVLMDCQMPRMDGFAATREIRRREGPARHLPIIAMTASAQITDHERCLEAGMDDFVSKPVDPAALATVLARWTHSGTAATGVLLRSPDDDPIGRRLDELRGEGSKPERELVDRLITSLLTRAPGYLTALEEALAAGDAVALEEQAHSLKGAVANLGATAPAEICQRLEDAGRSRRLDPAALAAAAEDLHRLRTAWQDAAERLRNA